MSEDYLRTLARKYIEARRQLPSSDSNARSAKEDAENARRKAEDIKKVTMGVIDRHEDVEFATTHALELGKALAAQQVAEARNVEFAALLAKVREDEAQCLKNLIDGCALALVK